MKKQRLKDLEKALLFGLIFTMVLSLAKFDASCEDLRSNILRFHIIANSDSPQDQDVKLKIRDEVLNESTDIFKDTDTLELAQDSAEENLDTFVKIANRVLSENGFDYTATANIGECFFNTREYDTFTLPAGYYNSLNIILGEGKGHNWWCVIYPAVCVGSSGAKLESAVNKKSSRIAEHPQKYKIKFKSVEIYEKIKKKIKN